MERKNKPHTRTSRKTRKSPKWKNKTQEFFATNKMVGAYIPMHQADRFSLYCLVYGKKRQPIIQEMLQEYIQNLPSTDMLLNNIKEMCLQEWLTIAEKYLNQIGWKTLEEVKNSWEIFKLDMTKKLRAKKISDAHINKVIHYIEYYMEEEL